MWPAPAADWAKAARSRPQADLDALVSKRPAISSQGDFAAAAAGFDQVAAAEPAFVPAEAVARNRARPGGRRLDRRRPRQAPIGRHPPLRFLRGEIDEAALAADCRRGPDQRRPAPDRPRRISSSPRRALIDGDARPGARPSSARLSQSRRRAMSGGLPPSATSSSCLGHVLRQQVVGRDQLVLLVEDLDRPADHAGVLALQRSSSGRSARPASNRRDRAGSGSADSRGRYWPAPGPDRDRRTGPRRSSGSDSRGRPGPRRSARPWPLPRPYGRRICRR